MADKLQSFIHKTVQQYIKTRYGLIDNLILEYLYINNNLSINDIELVESRIGDTDIIWYIREKGTND